MDEIGLPGVLADLSAVLHYRSKRCGLFDLPTELRMQIYANLDYGTALRLERVCRYFREDVPAQGVDREQRATYVYHAETFAKNKGRLACYSCVRILPRDAFDGDQRSGKYERFGIMELERICAKCQIKKGGISWATRYRSSVGRGAWKLRETIFHYARR